MNNHYILAIFESNLTQMRDQSVLQAHLLVSFTVDFLHKFDVSLQKYRSISLLVAYSVLVLYWLNGCQSHPVEVLLHDFRISQLTRSVEQIRIQVEVVHAEGARDGRPQEAEHLEVGLLVGGRCH